MVDQLRPPIVDTRVIAAGRHPPPGHAPVREELGEAFCRHQAAAAGGAPGHAVTGRNGVPPHGLRTFWKQMSSTMRRVGPAAFGKPCVGGVSVCGGARSGARGPLTFTVASVSFGKVTAPWSNGSVSSARRPSYLLFHSALLGIDLSGTTT